MCQATVYLDGEELMHDVLRVEHLPVGQVRLTTFFEPPRVVSAVIREIDLLKHRVMLESPAKPAEEQYPGSIS